MDDQQPIFTVHQRVVQFARWALQVDQTVAVIMNDRMLKSVTSLISIFNIDIQKSNSRAIPFVSVSCGDHVSHWQHCVSRIVFSSKDSQRHTADNNVVLSEMSMLAYHLLQKSIYRTVLIYFCPSTYDCLDDWYIFMIVFS